MNYKERYATLSSPDEIKKQANADIDDLLYVVRTNMTSITRYVRNDRSKHPNLSEGQYIDRQAEYKKLAEKAVNNILKYINEEKEIEEN